MGNDQYAIEVLGASKTFHAGRKALDKIDLQVRQGECIALLGASGSGKSTLLRAICGLEVLDNDGGLVHIEGQQLQAQARLSVHAKNLRRHMGIIFQQFNLVGRMQVLSNVLTGLLPHVPLWRSLIGHFNAQERLLALRALDMVGLIDQAQQRACTLSGGQQQRAAIARTLVQGARILLADEPVASLDPESTRRVLDILQQLNRSQGITVLISLHNVALAKQYCGRIVALREGRLVYDGPPSGLDDVRVHNLYDQPVEKAISVATAPVPAAAAALP